jgi:hypothetical protein
MRLLVSCTTPGVSACLGSLHTMFLLMWIVDAHFLLVGILDAEAVRHCYKVLLLVGEA